MEINYLEEVGLKGCFITVNLSSKWYNIRNFNVVTQVWILNADLLEEMG